MDKTVQPGDDETSNAMDRQKTNMQDRNRSVQLKYFSLTLRKVEKGNRQEKYKTNHEKTADWPFLKHC